MCPAVGQLSLSYTMENATRKSIGARMQKVMDLAAISDDNVDGWIRLVTKGDGKSVGLVRKIRSLNPPGG